MSKIEEGEASTQIEEEEASTSPTWLQLGQERLRLRRRRASTQASTQIEEGEATTQIEEGEATQIEEVEASTSPTWLQLGRRRRRRRPPPPSPSPSPSSLSSSSPSVEQIEEVEASTSPTWLQLGKGRRRRRPPPPSPSSLSSSSSSPSPSPSGYEEVPAWFSREGKINMHTRDEEGRVLVLIKERLSRYSWKTLVTHLETDGYLEMFRDCANPIYVNAMTVGDRKPMLVTIGPHYRDTIKPDVMELHKLKYLKDFVERLGSTVEDFVHHMVPCLRNLRSSLSSRVWEVMSGSASEIFEIWLLDGSFIIELFCKNIHPSLRGNDHLFESDRVLYALSRDLILSDNQLPYPVLEFVCNFVGGFAELLERKYGGALEFVHQYGGWSPIGLASKFLERIVPNQKLYPKRVKTNKRESYGYNLLSIVYEGFIPSLPNVGDVSIDVGDNKKGYGNWNLQTSASELQEFGVEFKGLEIETANEEADNLFDIKFTKGVLEIPRIRIRYGTASCISLLLEHEQSDLHPRQGRYLTDYLWFMNSLVKSPKDVQLLRQENIIDNLSELADDAAIHKFLKDLFPSLTISCTDFRYMDVCKAVTRHCDHRSNKWKANLRANYFNSPWAFISFLAASLLLILTATQTAYSVLAYYK